MTRRPSMPAVSAPAPHGGEPARRRVLLGALGAAGAAVLSACGPGRGGAGSDPARSVTAPASGSGSAAALPEGARALLARHGVEAATAEEAVAAVDRLPQARPLAFQGQVRADEVRFADAEGEAAAPLTAGLFYLSLAPYRTVTHDCVLHALGGCQGELADTDVRVRVTAADGRVLVDEEARTGANGFTGHWVPRGLTGTVEVRADGRTATCPFDSGPSGATCLTELRLA